MKTTRSQKSPLYYTVRTLVRITIWGLVASLGITCAAALVSSSKDNTPKCDVMLELNFTWYGNVNQCEKPEGVVLKDNGTWEWANPDLG